MNNSYRPFGGFSVFPPVIKNLMIINVAVFFIQMIANNLMLGGKPLWYVLNLWFALNPISEGFNFQIWQLITYQFMHGGFSHIFFNMFMLWMFGMEIENMWGSKKFLTYYLICGIAAGLAQLFIAPLFSTPAVTIGASGAIFGVMIAFGMLFPDRHIFLYFLIPIRSKYLIGFLFILEIFWIGDAGSNVAHLAHLGGALAGFLFIMFDKTIDVPLKRMLNISGYRRENTFNNPFSGLSDKFKKRSQIIEDASYYDINQKKDGEEITQAEIDAILDKISQSGYQNLSEREKKILFEASKKMN
ncbi:MAG: rhomboid family intramembrane serine protease [Ignavibacteria bacterium RBG_16_36_9]|nr:MAG: rhomboid family intramembrane serine protease [Ignavibacteria bacterium RBG_16_36_9]